MTQETNGKEIRIYEVSLPAYSVDAEPEHETVGAELDKLIIREFAGQHVAIRCLGTTEHPGKTVDEMIEIIKKLGHDRYDPNRVGDRYENIEGKKIDFFALEYNVDDKTEVFKDFTWPFFHWSKKKIGVPVRIDIMIIYDPAKLEQIEFTYAGRESEGTRNDGFVFKDPVNKSEAIKAIIKIL